MNKTYNLEIGDKVYVKNWGQIYSDTHRFVNGIKESFWNWKTKIPEYSNTDFFWKTETTPKLTLKGVPRKDGSYDIISRTPLYKNFEYEILEKIEREDGEIICLLSSEEGCCVQIGIEGLTIMTPEEQDKVAHLHKEKYLQALSVNNLNKWSINSNLNEFPKELIKVLYDEDQRTCFGSDFPNTRAIITHRYIPKEYTIDNIPLYLGWNQNYNGVGCDLDNKKTVSWNDLKKIFLHSNFSN